MSCSNPSYFYFNDPSWVLTTIIFLLYFTFSVLSDPRISQAGLYCGDVKAPLKANYVPSFVKEMESLSQLVATSNWGVHFVNSTVPIYGFAQCFHDLSRTDCLLCYAASRTKLPRCLPSVSARIYLDGCFLRYDNYNFYTEDTNPKRDTVNCSSQYGLVVGEKEKLELSKSVGQVIDNVSRIAVSEGKGFGVGEVEGIYALAQCWKTVGVNGCRNCLNKAAKQVRGCVPNREGRALNAGCYLRYSTVKFYDEGDKAEGGNGSFRRGAIIATVLAAAAIIMLSLSASYAVFSRLSKIRRERSNLGPISTSLSRSSLNLNIEGPESLLVYEYLPNKSLDQFIFEKNRTQILTWKQRFDIILGTAEGLAYLHGGSKIRIIHRDIKSSNILLDSNMTPKIADFGLARCFGTDKTHLSTGIAGTLGYMAPEYLIRGQLTDKADVYSYGVLLLEIICGRRNNVFREDSSSLLQTVWKLSRSNRVTEAVDPCLGAVFPAKETSTVLQIGLLCTQASASLRPSMAEVVYMLSNPTTDIPVPNQPPFMNTGMPDSDSSIRSFSTNSFVSNALKKIGVSRSSSESSSMRSDGPARSEEPIMEV
ncbi:hypothetical protein L6164_005097 [Bauhinia variegata]|uniref:Uncharacterized protein n=1 Tax=Bauhinia variegata TaxID=167791 RepID=A0ACB9PRM2_BAUVA|nr:hypothetical protein L6164_005097 [Bauhinia variegata]